MFKLITTNLPQSHYYDFGVSNKEILSFFIRPNLIPYNNNLDSSIANPLPGEGAEVEKAWQVKLLHNGNLIQGTTLSNPTSSDTEFTRKNVLNSNTNIWSGLFGEEFPYRIEIDTPGLQTLQFIIYNDPFTGDNWIFTHTFYVYQTAIATTRLNSNSGQALADGTIFTSFNTSSTVILDRSNNRGIGLSYFEVFKMEAVTGNFLTATEGVDFSLVNPLTTLGDLNIELAFLTEGMFMVRNTVSDYAIDGYAINYSNCDVYFIVDDTNSYAYQEDVVFPAIINAKLIEEESGDEISNTNSRLIEGKVVEFVFDFDITNAKFYQKFINPVTNDVDINNDFSATIDWQDLILRRFNFYTVLRDSVTKQIIHQIKYSNSTKKFVIPYFTSTNSSFEIGLKVEPKLSPIHQPANYNPSTTGSSGILF